MILNYRKMDNTIKQHTYSEKYNSLYDRTEYFDSVGKVFAFSRKNKIHQRIEFYKANGAFIKFKEY